MRIPTLAAWIAALALVAGASSATEEQVAPVADAAQAAMPAADAAQVQAPTAPPAGSVERSALTSLVFDREPQDALEEVASDRGRIFYFTEILDMPGETVLHRWEHDGAVMAEVPFEVGSTRWRTYSSKDLDPSWLGRWSVSTLDASGRVLDTREFRVVEAAGEVAPPAAATP
jgi:nucleoid-associated protein YgaU